MAAFGKGGVLDAPSRLEREALTGRFLAAFGPSDVPVVVAFAPGRANVIGEHTDYQEGLVMPFALDKGVYVAFRARDDDALRVFAEDFNAWGEARLSEVRRRRLEDPAYGPRMDPKWLRYCAAPFDWLRFGDGSRCDRGCDALVASDVPVGGGVSSSSALTVAFAVAARFLHRERPLAARTDGKDAFLLATCEAEWHFSGLQGGMMDQTASYYGRRGKVFAIDCRVGALRDLDDAGGDAYVSADGAAFVVLNTMVAHSLPDSPYAKRRASCEAVARAMAERWPERAITHLRDASDLGDAQGLKMVEDVLASGAVSDEDARRARHGVVENNRVRRAARAFGAKDWPALGALMTAAHASLRDLYAVSCAELDLACDAAADLDGCHGARMMGGGFGGCVIALCDPAKAQTVAKDLKARYKARTARLTGGEGIDATVFATTPGPGASLQAPDDPHPVQAIDIPALWATS